MLSPEMVVVFGTVCLDRIRRVKSLPSRGGYVEIDEERILLGGEAANTALCLKQWGTEIRLFGNTLGHGSDARLLRDLLVEKGLPVERLREGPAPTPICDVYVTPDGDRTMFGQGFRDMESAAELEGVTYVAGEWFTAEPNMPVLAAEAVRKAADQGMRVYTMDFVRADDPIPEGSYWQTSTDWAGVRGDGPANVAWVQALIDRTGCFAILTDGGNGFVAGGPKTHAAKYPAFPLDRAVDSTGAGDAFRAGMLFGLEGRWPIADCLAFASAAGCLSCLALGATSAVPSHDEVRALIGAHPDIVDAFRAGCA